MIKETKYETAMEKFKKGKLVRSEYMAQSSYICEYTEITDKMKKGKWYIEEDGVCEDYN